ncbi:MAG: GtrA family protein, partial [Minisyncoccota bacterium]
LFHYPVEIGPTCYTARVLPNPMTLRPLHNLLRLYAGLTASHPSLMRLARFVISGGTATAVNLGTLFVLTHFFGVWYIYSSIAAFAISFFVSFALQKLWTFGNRDLGTVHLQATKFLTVILVALGINTTLIYAFVEYMHVHYLIGQLVSGLFIAVINYFSYKHLVFSEPRANTAILATSQSEPISYPQVVLLLAAVLLFAFLALFRLSENPPTWLDEGTITQVAINLAQSGTYGIQIAPGNFISTDFLTTSFPVIYPVALSFLTLGTNILSARIVMVIFMALLCVFSYLLIRALTLRDHRSVAISSLLLLVTFAPLYGHGKNVLGEVPGLMFFVASLFALSFAEKSSRASLWALSGALLGLSMVTKPTYLFVIAPTAFLMLLAYRKRLSLRQAGAYAGASLAILVSWFFIHFTDTEALGQILFAANADNTALSARVGANVARFFTELQPLYFLGLIGIWWLSLLYRMYQKVSISHVELFAAIFSAMNLVLFLASRGFYRYFFPAEVLALVFLPLALSEIPVRDRYQRIFRRTCGALIVLLVFFQGYQTFFSSWIAEYKDSARSALLGEHLGSLPREASIFLYNVPEAAIFLPSPQYYQYLNFGDNVIRGEENLALLDDAMLDFVLVDLKFKGTEALSHGYSEKARFDKYVLYERISR